MKSAVMNNEKFENILFRCQWSAGVHKEQKGKVNSLFWFLIFVVIKHYLLPVISIPELIRYDHILAEFSSLKTVGQLIAYILMQMF